jgi:hypothetical protein
VTTIVSFSEGYRYCEITVTLRALDSALGFHTESLTFTKYRNWKGRKTAGRLTGISPAPKQQSITVIQDSTWRYDLSIHYRLRKHIAYRELEGPLRLVHLYSQTHFQFHSVVTLLTLTSFIGTALTARQEVRLDPISGSLLTQERG